MLYLQFNFALQLREESMRALRDLMFEQTVLNFGQIFSKEKQNVQFKYENGNS